jgi:hypothetical protein
LRHIKEEKLKTSDRYIEHPEEFTEEEEQELVKWAGERLKEHEAFDSSPFASKIIKRHGRYLVPCETKDYGLIYFDITKNIEGSDWMAKHWAKIMATYMSRRKNDNRLCKKMDE